MVEAHVGEPDPPDLCWLLCERRERCRKRARAQRKDETSPVNHWITSSTNGGPAILHLLAGSHARRWVTAFRILSHCCRMSPVGRSATFKSECERFDRRRSQNDPLRPVAVSRCGRSATWLKSSRVWSASSPTCQEATVGSSSPVTGASSFGHREIIP